MTIALVATALLVWFAPVCRNVLIFDRDAILHGQLWRIVTAQFVHFSVSHLICDCAVVAIAGIALEGSGSLRFALLGLIASIAIGAGVFVFEPQVRFYGGLSGLAMCFVVALGVEWVATKSQFRWLGFLILVSAAAKLVAELSCDGPIFADLPTGVVSAWSVHLVGALAGALLVVLAPRAKSTIV